MAMLPKHKVSAPLDLEFQPATLCNRAYRESVADGGVPCVIGLERENGLLSRYETRLLEKADAKTIQYVERIAKFLLWARGGWKIHFGGPREIGESLARDYAKGGLREFDADLMQRVYERPFEVFLTKPEIVPAERESGTALGGHLDGCRIGFDLGASDYKVCAVQEGRVVYSDEFPWNPKEQPDPQYHYGHLHGALKKAAAQLPRVDAIGGSSAGVIVDNRIMVASLFRAVPAERFGDAAGIFLRLRRDWGVPLEVLNDGDVTALAGAMSLGVRGVLGIAMGSSEAAGFVDSQGRILGWLNELAFAPVDYNPAAAADEWSGDRGVGALYFSQQAVGKLLPSAGIELPKEMGLPERLKEVQAFMAKDDPRARKIYETIGVYLGYTIPHYADFYDMQHALILGRVTTGAGGDIVIGKAREVLQKEFPEIADRVTLHVPDEKSRRVGQAVAAASIPAIQR